MTDSQKEKRYKDAWESILESLSADLKKHKMRLDRAHENRHTNLAYMLEGMINQIQLSISDMENRKARIEAGE